MVIQMTTKGRNLEGQKSLEDGNLAPVLPRFGWDIPPIFVQDSDEAITEKLHEFLAAVAVGTLEFDHEVQAHIDKHGSESPYSSEQFTPNVILRLPVAIEESTAYHTLATAARVLARAIELAPEHDLTVIDVEDFNTINLLDDGEGNFALNDFGAVVGLGFSLHITWGDHAVNITEQVASQNVRHLKLLSIAGRRIREEAEE